MTSNPSTRPLIEIRNLRKVYQTPACDSLGMSLLARPLDFIFSVPAVLMWLGLMTVISMIASRIPAQSAARLTIREALVYE